MANVTKPPILDETGQTIKQKLSEILAALQSSGGSYIPLSQKGAANGVAELDANGKVPSAQLPSYVDDVLEYASLSNFPATGESGKIYIAIDTNKSYRWSGSTYVEISSSLALGETSSTAYRGDRGKTAYDHATESGKISAAVASGLYKIAATAQGHIAGLTAVQKSDLTALGVADSDNIPTKTSQLTNDSGFVTDGQGAKTVKASIVTLSDAAAIYAEDITAYITAVQDLHGYSNPWVGGAGKNKLPMTVAGIKANNTGSAYSWSGNVCTVYNVTLTILTDSVGNVTGIKVNGTASNNVNFYITINEPFNGNYKLNGCSGGGSTTYRLYVYTANYSTEYSCYDGDVSMTLPSDNYRTTIFIRSGTTISNKVFYPMIRLATETDPTFAPYTNICPITGYTECEVERVGANQWDEEWENGYYNRQTGEKAGNTDTKYYRSKNFIPCFPSEQYYIKLPAVHKDNNTYFAVIYYDKDKNFISSAFTVLEPTITTPANAYYLTFYVEVGTSGATYNNDIAINHPASVTTYSTYQGQDYVMPLSNKNLIPMQFDNTHILAYNTSGSWNDHTYTEYGVDITVYTLTKYSDIVTGIRIKGDATNNLSFMLCSYGDDFVFTEALKMNASGTSNADIDIIAMDKNNTSKAEIRTTLSSADVSVTDNKFAKVVVIVNSGFSGDVMIYPQIRKAKYSADFAPHNPRLPEVVYGGTLDVTSGVLTVDRKSVNPKDLTIAKNSQSADNYVYYIANLYGVADFASGNKWKCSHLERSSSINNAGTFYPHSSYNVCYMNFGSIIGTNTVDGFKQYCQNNNVQLVYVLATPEVYYLTPQEVKLLLNLNNITASTGQVQVKYQPNNAIGEAIGYIQNYIERHAPKTYYPKII